MGTAHVSPPWVNLESPKAVLTECIMFWRVMKVHRIGSLGTQTLCCGREEIMWTTRLYSEINSANVLVADTLFCLIRY